jgi:hypothetical protein
MKKLYAHLDELASHIADMEKRNERISASTVGWQIEHSLMTIRFVTKGLLASDPSLFSRSFNFTKIFILFTGKMPRGKAKAPKYVLPDEFNEETLQKHILKTKEALAELTLAQPNQFVEHPYFGKINKKETIRFLGIHTFHHIKIIRDILAA